MVSPLNCGNAALYLPTNSSHLARKPASLLKAVHEVQIATERAVSAAVCCPCGRYCGRTEHYRARCCSGARISTSSIGRVGGSGRDEFEQGGAVGVELLLADAADARELFERRRLRDRDAAQGRVAKHD